MSEDRLTWHLDNWAFFQREQETDYGRAFASEDGSGAIGYGSQAFDDMVFVEDLKCAQAVNAIMPSLSSIEFAAVSYHHGAAVFRY